MLRIAELGLGLTLAWSATAQMPAPYRSVDRVTWVVDDLDRVLGELGKIGVVQADRSVDLDLPVTFRDKPCHTKLRAASGFVLNVRVLWIQPVEGDNAWSEFLKEHGTGVFSLMHRLPTPEALRQEVARLRGLGVAVLQQVDYRSAAGSAHFVFMDTEAEGKYVLGLVVLPDGYEERERRPAPELNINQFAFAVHDLKPVSAYWERLGLGALAINRANLSDVRHRGKPIAPDALFGWQRNRKVPYEWIQPITRPNVYDDHMAVSGEGLQHFGVPTSDIEKSAAAWTGTGLQVSQSGWWGKKGKPGSGRFAYIDTENACGASLELTWQYREP